MTERYDDSAAGAARPMSTGEFRAVPDSSASTAEFRAFAESDAGPERPWEAGASRRNMTRVALIVMIAAVALAAIVFAFVG